MPAARLEMLTPSQAAAVSQVTVRDVNRAIDEKILPESLYIGAPDRARRLNAAACVFLSFYFATARQLTSEERLRTIAAVSARLPGGLEGTTEKEWIVCQESLTIDLSPFLKGVRGQLERLSSARALVVEDPEILGGTPVVRGTRIPVFDIASFVAAGDSMERILDGYPSLTAETVELVQFYARANPQRGRPRRSTSPPAGATIISSRRLPTSRAAIQKLAS